MNFRGTSRSSSFTRRHARRTRASLFTRKLNKIDSRLVQSLHTKRLGTAEDIAAAALFLASEQANWITGQVLSVDGGRS